MDNHHTKILVCGDVEGKIRQLFKRVNTINEKNGPFHMLLCVGEFFGTNDDDWIECKKKILKASVPTFILGPNSMEMGSFYPCMRGGELAENLIYLGHSGIYTSSTGLKIAYLSGKDRKLSGISSSKFGFALADIMKLETCAGINPQIDILITGEWSKGVTKFVKAKEGITEETGSLLISRLAQKLKPRYHFVATEGVFYERLPYRNHIILQEQAHHVSRFIALGKVGNPNKEKWIYAFNTVPLKHMSEAESKIQPADVTENPFGNQVIFLAEKLYGDKSRSGNKNQFFYDMSSRTDDQTQQNGKRKNMREKKEIKKRRDSGPRDPCWFCLSSPQVEKHLVVSVGSSCYLALAKGGLVTDHLLILPIQHFRSSLDIPDEAKEEMEKFKSSLKEMFFNEGKCVVFFERNFHSMHLQIQVVPLPNKFRNDIKQNLLDTSEDCGIDLEELPNYSSISHMVAAGNIQFFYAELPDGEKLFHKVVKTFPLQFGRELLASTKLLNMPDRVDWKKCKIDQETETKIRDQIRLKYQPYDFTLNDSNEDSSDSEDGS